MNSHRIELPAMGCGLILRMAAAVLAATFLLVACATAMKAAGYPPNPTRAEPPAGLSEKALAIGSRAPAFSLPASTGVTWSLGNVLGDRPVVILFYRGHW